MSATMDFPESNPDFTFVAELAFSTRVPILCSRFIMSSFFSSPWSAAPYVWCARHKSASPAFACPEHRDGFPGFPLPSSQCGLSSVFRSHPAASGRHAVEPTVAESSRSSHRKSWTRSRYVFSAVLCLRFFANFSSVSPSQPLFGGCVHGTAEVTQLTVCRFISNTRLCQSSGLCACGNPDGRDKFLLVDPVIFSGHHNSGVLLRTSSVRRQSFLRTCSRHHVSSTSRCCVENYDWVSTSGRGLCAGKCDSRCSAQPPEFIGARVVAS